MNQHVNRREALAAVGAATALAALAHAQPGDSGRSIRIGTPKPAMPVGWDDAAGQFVLPPLPYDPAALEPHIDAKTMGIHHGKHHQGYVDGANKALKQLASIREGGDAGLVKHWSKELSFHVGGHINHTLFWSLMAPPGKGGGGQPAGSLAAAITRDFGAVDKFVAHFKAAAQQVEGSGWAWLAVEPLSKRLIIVQMEKQQDLMPGGVAPVLGIDVWEHAYYLKYENRRSAYVDAWFNLVNWSFAQSLFDAATT
jgi:superoxide dismutase, Fe-Mn family